MNQNIINSNLKSIWLNKVPTDVTIVNSLDGIYAKVIATIQQSDFLRFFLAFYQDGDEFECEVSDIKKYEVFYAGYNNDYPEFVMLGPVLNHGAYIARLAGTDDLIYFNGSESAYTYDAAVTKRIISEYQSKVS